MRKIVITLDTDNDAFSEDVDGEVARILDKLVRNGLPRSGVHKLMDVNGNTVGKVEVNTDYHGQTQSIPAKWHGNMMD